MAPRRSCNAANQVSSPHPPHARLCRLNTPLHSTLNTESAQFSRVVCILDGFQRISHPESDAVFSVCVPMRCSPSALPMTLLKRWELPRLSSEKGPSRIELFQIFFVPEHWCPPYLLLTSWFLWAITGSATILKKVGRLHWAFTRLLHDG
ncbi:hypothetical protein BDD12DRAFT_384862 [Trichophaea hybrida]|nr:hypothetical protein BDD12DRAFT_384862 [Trichophaea hybrida]